MDGWLLFFILVVVNVIIWLFLNGNATPKTSNTQSTDEMVTVSKTTIKKQQPSEQDPPRQHPVDKYLDERPLSFSSLKVYLDCPKKFKYAYLDKRPEKGRLGQAGLIGSAVHAAIELAYKNFEKDQTIQMLQNEALRYIDDEVETDFAPSTISKIKTESQRLTKDFFNNFYKKVNLRPIAVEMKVDGVLPSGVNVTGRIDLVAHHASNNAHQSIIDFKTGQLRDRGSFSEFDEIQVLLYAGLLSQQAEANYEAGYYYLREDHYYSQKVDSQIAQSILNMVDNKVHEMRRDHTFLANPGYYCSFCDFRDACPNALKRRSRRSA